MSPTKIQTRVVRERINWIRQMQGRIQDLPLNDPESLAPESLVAAAAESYLRRCLEALLDLGRHILAKGFGRSATEYKAVADGLQGVGVLTAEEAATLRTMAGYRNRLVHFYDEVSPEEILGICRLHISDIDLTVQAIERWLGSHPDSLDSEP